MQYGNRPDYVDLRSEFEETLKLGDYSRYYDHLLSKTVLSKSRSALTDKSNTMSSTTTLAQQAASTSAAANGSSAQQVASGSSSNRRSL